jgi:hypothetical protein
VEALRLRLAEAERIFDEVDERTEFIGTYTSDLYRRIRAWRGKPEPMHPNCEPPCPMCDGTIADLEAERALLVARVENAEAALVEAEATIAAQDKMLAEWESHKLDERLAEEEEWHKVALILGETLASVGLDDYYKMSPREWLAWAMKVTTRN